MKPRKLFFVIMVAASVFLMTPSSSVPYSGFPISQMVYMKCILSEDTVPAWAGRNPTIKEIAASANGVKIAFTVELSDPWEKRLYEMDQHGSGLTDITSSLPGAVSSHLNVRQLQYDSTGTRLFFVWNWLSDIYYCDGGSSHLVVDGITSGYTLKPFAVNEYGDKLFFRDARWDEQQQKTLRGIYAVQVGGSPQLAVDIDDLPCDDSPPSAWYSRLALLDCSGDGNVVFFRWVTGISSLDKHTMFKLETGQSPQKYPDEEHDQIWSSAYSLKNRITDVTGQKILYAYKDTGQPWVLSFASASGNDPIAKTNDPNGFAFVSLDRSGAERVRFYARSGFRHTLYRPDGVMRDSWSEHIPGGDPFSNGYLATDIRYFITGGENRFVYYAATREAGTDRIYSVEVGDVSDPGWMFGIVDIYYDRHPLYMDDSTPLSVYAKALHSTGLSEIHWVNLHALMDGREYIDWKLNHPDWDNSVPIYYDAGMHDDGDFGDEEAGDGVYTNTTVRGRPDSGFYSEYGFPCYPGSRVVLRDMGSNYFIADSVFKVDERSLCPGDGDGDRDVDGGDLFSYMSGASSITIDSFAQDFGRLNCL